MPDPPAEVLARIVADQHVEHFTYLADAAGDFPAGRAEAAYVFDVYGNQFLDLSAGDGVMVLGHRNETVIEAVITQLRQHQHTAPSGAHISVMVARYAKALSASFPDVDGEPQQVLFCTTDAEAREVAARMAKAITGRTLIADLGLTPDEQRMSIITHPYASWAAIAAVRLELIGSDMTPMDASWARMAAEKAETMEAVVIVDETATGYGRTGSLWAHQPYGIDPTITVLGGAGGGGFPFGAVVSSRANFAAYTPPQRLFGASPVICCAGWSVLDQITPELCAHVRTTGRIFATGMVELVGQFPDLIQGSRGMGLAQGISFCSPAVASWFQRAAPTAGLLVRAPVCERIIPVTPPLIISEAEMRRTVDLVASVCLDWTGPL